MGGMTKEDVLRQLTTFGSGFPRRAVRGALSMWDTIADDMVLALENVAADLSEYAGNRDYMLHLYAMFLCAERRDVRAYAPMLRILRHPVHDEVDALLGDTLTEDAGRILASVNSGSIEGIQELVEDTASHEYARSVGLTALQTRVVEGDLPGETLIEYLSTLLESRLEREPAVVWDATTSVAATIGAREVWPLIQTAFDEGLLDPLYAGRDFLYTSVMGDPAVALEQARKNPRYRYVQSAVASMEWWSAFKESPQPNPTAQPKPPAPPAPAPARKIGRNERCPCGSGRKYKHCCGR
jgi:hypothetical protein